MFYLGAAVDLKGRVIAVVLQELGEAGPVSRAQVLTEWDWGEKEVLRMLRDRGFFTAEGPRLAGPRIVETVRVLARRLEAVGFRTWAAGELDAFLTAKALRDMPAGPSLEGVPEAHARGEFGRVLALLDEERLGCLAPSR